MSTRRPKSFTCDGDHADLDEKDLRRHYAYGCKDQLTRAAVARKQRENMARREGYGAPYVRPNRTAAAATADSTVPVRKLRALVAMGWSPARLATRLAVDVDTTWWLLLTPPPRIRPQSAARVDRVYRQLRYEHPPETYRPTQSEANRARLLAKQHGWKSPFQWHDIESITEKAS